MFRIIRRIPASRTSVALLVILLGCVLAATAQAQIFKRSTIGGEVVGLDGSSSVELKLSSGVGLELLTTQNGPFTFEKKLPRGTSYRVSVRRQPIFSGQTCRVENSSGVADGNRIDDVVVRCFTPTYSVGGEVSGLEGEGLSLRSDNGDVLDIATNGPYTFPTEYELSERYSVRVARQPSNPAQLCTIANARGVVLGFDIRNVDVQCERRQFSVGGTVTGLLGDGLVLRNNGGDDLAIDADGSFTFPTSLDDGSAYEVAVAAQPTNPVQTCTVSQGTGELSGFPVNDIEVTCTTDRFSVGGTVTGLEGSGLVLQNNGGDDLPISSNGTFVFSTTLEDLTDYSVTVASQPVDPSQTCTVAEGEGALSGADKTDVEVICTINQFSVGGNVTGLEGNGLILRNNGGDPLEITGNGSFIFPTPLNDSTSFEVTITAQPTDPQQTCSLTGGNGTLSGSDVTDVQVACTTDQFSLGGTISGLEGDGLILQNNGGDDLSVDSDGSFTFASPLDDGSNYQITVAVQPTDPSQTCTVSNAAGSIQAVDIDHVRVDCTTDQFTVGGTVSGLSGSGLVLQNNGGDDLTVSGDGAFVFANPLDDGSGFAVTVATQPLDPRQTCTVSNGSGQLSGADVTDVRVNCEVETFSVGGTVTGLSGSGLTLQNNATDELAIASDGSFTFSEEIQDQSDYEVTIAVQPDGQFCMLDNGRGVVEAAPVTNVMVRCEDRLLTLSASSIDFGELTLGEGEASSIRVSNSGAGAVEGIRVNDPGHPFTVVGGSCLPSADLLEGESCLIEVAFNPRFGGQFAGSLEISANASNAPVDVSLRGNAVMPVPVPLSSAGALLTIALLLMLSGCAVLRPGGR